MNYLFKTLKYNVFFRTFVLSFILNSTNANYYKVIKLFKYKISIIKVFNNKSLVSLIIKFMEVYQSGNFISKADPLIQQLKQQRQLQRNKIVGSIEHKKRKKRIQESNVVQIDFQQKIDIRKIKKNRNSLSKSQERKNNQKQKEFVINSTKKNDDKDKKYKGKQDKGKTCRDKSDKCKTDKDCAINLKKVKTVKNQTNYQQEKCNSSTKNNSSKKQYYQKSTIPSTLQNSRSHYCTQIKKYEDNNSNNINDSRINANTNTNANTKTQQPQTQLKYIKYITLLQEMVKEGNVKIIGLVQQLKQRDNLLDQCQKQMIKIRMNYWSLFQSIQQSKQIGYLVEIDEGNGRGSGKKEAQQNNRQIYNHIPVSQHQSNSMCLKQNQKYFRIQYTDDSIFIDKTQNQHHQPTHFSQQSSFQISNSIVVNDFIQPDIKPLALIKTQLTKQKLIPIQHLQSTQNINQQIDSVRQSSLINLDQSSQCNFMVKAKNQIQLARKDIEELKKKIDQFSQKKLVSSLINKESRAFSSFRRSSKAKPANQNPNYCEYQDNLNNLRLNQLEAYINQQSKTKNIQIKQQIHLKSNYSINKFNPQKQPSPLSLISNTHRLISKKYQ